MPNYIKRIEVHGHYKCGNFYVDFEAESGGKPFRHLILTGPNDSGKTTILTKLAESAARGISGSTIHSRQNRLQSLDSEDATINDRCEFPALIDQARKELGERRDALLREYLVEESWTRIGPFLPQTFFAFLPAQRTLQIEKPVATGTVIPPSHRGANFLSLLVYLHVQKVLALEEEPEVAAAMDRWLKSMNTALADLFEIPGLEMKFLRSKFDIHLVEPSGVEYDFSHLAAGHASVFGILGQILLHAEECELVATGGAFAGSSGVVLIDEIDAHLHPSLQGRILPFLVNAFPSVQFIITTHSPFVLRSLPREGSLVVRLPDGRAFQQDFSSWGTDDILSAVFEVEGGWLPDIQEKLSELRRLAAQAETRGDALRLYWEMANRSEPLRAACDGIVATVAPMELRDAIRAHEGLANNEGRP